MNVHVSLTEDLASFVESKVATGSFASMSDVVRESLRLMDRVERAEAEKLVYLRSAWQHGIDSGDAGELDFSALKEELAYGSRLRRRESVARVRYSNDARQDLLSIWARIAI